jgi:S-DNA-T family DNA segregation ATPase FtsK/SpoIIIE
VSGSALSRRVSEFVGVALFAAALFWLIALATYDAADPVWFFNTGGSELPANFAGRVGAFLAELSYQVLGFAAYVLPLVVAAVAWHYFWCQTILALYTKVIGLVLTLGCSASFLSLAFGTAVPPSRTFQAGGYVGWGLASVLAEYLNRAGSIIVILTLLFLALILTTQVSFGLLFATTTTKVGHGGARVGRSMRDWWTERRKARTRQQVLRKHLDKTGASSARTEVLAKGAVSPTPKKKRRPRRSETAASPAITSTSPESVPLPLPEPITRTPAERRQGAFTLPPLTLLDPPRAHHKFDERELMENARLLEDKCREFAVEGSVVQIHPGPVVTTFEFKPDAGVKYSKVTGLADDLCLAMEAESVLIERLPGKSTVGIQIPNRVRETISLRQMLESESYRNSASKLTLALGCTIHGEPVAGDLATMPHLLIAGSTGTGKSVGMNAMLTSILYRATPEEVRLIMIDPKRLELGMYEDIPHLLTPVVVEPKLAANALRWAVQEMEERYKTLAAAGVRNLDQYNRNVREQLTHAPVSARGATNTPSGDEDALPTTLPAIVLAIDELADLMMLVGNEVEESIARLAQMARAVGIHLILATQRPSVDVITGLIKANLPARIAFRVSSKVDSRTILDANGAERLLGRGDMLYLPPASSRVVRVHGPYISEQETARVCGFLRKQGRPAYDTTITAEEKPVDALAFDKDDLYDEASRLVVAAGQASISYLQRRLRIGFSRAARLVDMMEADGLVSPGNGGKAREVLVGADYFEQVDLQLR